MIREWLRRLRYDPIAVAKHDRRVSCDPTAVILPSTRFDFRGAGGRVTLAADAMVGATFTFESDAGSIAIGERSYIGAGTQLISRASITVGDEVMIAWGCYLYDHDGHSTDWHDRVNDLAAQLRAHREGIPLTANKDWTTVRAARITISDKVWIGFEAVILKGVTVGEGAIVAARAVVTRDVPPWCVVAGNPAVVVRKLETGADRLSIPS